MFTKIINKKRVRNAYDFSGAKYINIKLIRVYLLNSCEHYKIMLMLLKANKITYTALQVIMSFDGCIDPDLNRKNLEILSF